MKKVFGLLTAALVMFSFDLAAQTADEIVNKNIEAMGGSAKLASLKSMKMTGSMSVQGTDVALTITRVQNIGWRLDLEIMGQANYQMVNAEKGFIYMPVMGMAAPEEMDAETYKGTSGQMDAQGALFNYKDKGTTVEYLGKETTEGVEAYKLKITRKNGKTITYFIDTKTNRLAKTVSTGTVNGQEMEIIATYSDYKQNADGYWFAYTQTNVQGTITYDKIESNIPVDESIFKN